MASRAAHLFEQAIGASTTSAPSLAKSLAGRTFESLLAKSESHEPSPAEHVTYGSPSGARSEATLENDAPWLVNGAKFKVIHRPQDKVTYKTVGESHALFKHADNKDVPVHTAKVPEIAERVYREGHAIVTSRGGRNAVPQGANHPNSPDHAAYEYHHAVQLLDPAREAHRLATAKKAGAMTEGAKQVRLDEGVGDVNNQHVSHLPTHMAQIVHGMAGEQPHGAMQADHLRDTVVKFKRGAARQAWWGRVLHHLSENPASEAPGRESTAAHPDLSKYSTRAHVLYHARMKPDLSLAELHEHVKPFAADDTGKNGRSRRVALKIWGAHPDIGHVFNNPAIKSSSDALEHLATLPTKGVGQIQKHESLGVDYVTPAIRAHIDDHLKTFRSDHPSLTGVVAAPKASILDKIKAPASKKQLAPPTLGPPGSH